MSDMKCPFCGQELEETMFARGRVFVSCNNPKCPIMDWGGCSKQIITELIRTREELHKANAELDYIKEQVEKSNAFIRARIKVAAEQIARGIIDQVKTIKEQKDVK